MLVRDPSVFSMSSQLIVSNITTTTIIIIILHWTLALFNILKRRL